MSARLPLFDRLIDAEPGSPDAGDVIALDRDGLVASIERELELLLGTRCPRTLAEIGDATRSVVDYGLPEVSIDLNRGTGAEAAKVIEATIRAFEPRLANVSVTLRAGAPGEGRVVASLTADLVTARGREPVRFELDDLALGRG